MFAISGIQHHSIYGQSHTGSVNYSLPVYNISNSSYQFINNKPIALAFLSTSSEANNAHDLAYSSHKKRVKKEVREKRHSEATCRKSSEELHNLIAIAVAYPNSWYRNENRIKALQNIVKDADCLAIK